MCQLWANLPASDKMAEPGYQSILKEQIPVAELPAGAGSVRVIAGEFGGQHGPARSFTPMDVLDMRFKQGATAELPTREGHTLALVVLQGTLLINGNSASKGQLVHLDRAGSGVVIEANSDAVVLWLSGEPINEPIVGHGPFVMNSQDEIVQAIDDFNAGRFGQMPA